jgi:hypothetical protein
VINAILNTAAPVYSLKGIKDIQWKKLTPFVATHRPCVTLERHRLTFPF